MNRILRWLSCLTAVLALTLTTASLGGCHTVEGAAEDVESGAEGLEEAAEEAGAEDY
jgi:predicted small secreted protein